MVAAHKARTDVNNVSSMSRDGSGIRMMMWAGATMEAGPRTGQAAGINSRPSFPFGGIWPIFGNDGKRFFNETITRHGSVGYLDMMPEGQKMVCVTDSKWDAYCEYQAYDHQAMDRSNEYMLAMALELRANAADFADCEVQAIRLGGGSASITNGSDIDHLLRLIRSCYHVAENAPVTMRTCPADINGANMPFYNRSHITRYDLELNSLEPLDFCTLDTLNYTQQMPYITHGFLRADSRNSMGFILLYGKKNVSRYGFRHSVLEATRRPVCHVILQRCAGRDMLDDAAAEAQLAEADELLTAVGFVQYLPRRWAKPGCEDKFWQGAAAGMDVLAFGLCACTKLDGMETTNTGDLSVYLAHSADYEQITVSTVPAEKNE